MRGGALVTGASQRIGRALALAAAGAGYDVVIHHGNHPAEAEDAAAEVRALGRNAVTIAGDLADPATPDRLVAEAAAAIGPLSLLVNNASAFVDDRVGSMAREGWDAQLAVNLAAPVFLTQAFAAQAEAGRNNLVVNLVDQRVLKPNPQFFSYTVAKTALWNATRTMAQALAPQRIRINAIGPGPTLRSVYQTPERFAAEAGATLLGHGAELADIVDALLYLIDAPAVTGQMIAVDGGQHLGWRTPDILDD